MSNKYKIPSTSQHPLRATWYMMKARCYQPTATGYRFYGARGIQVCDAWRNDFWAFVSDMGPRPYGFTLDRIDGDGNYEPGNCRWADKATQGQNQRPRSVRTAKKKITYNGVSLWCKEWSDRTGIKAGTIKARLGHGWSVGEALGFVPHVHKSTAGMRESFNPSIGNFLDENGNRTMLKDLAARFNVDQVSLRKYLEQGYDLIKSVETIKGNRDRYKNFGKQPDGDDNQPSA